MKILFAGAGALGSRFGYMLFKNNEDVTFVDFWEEHVRNITNNGLKVIMIVYNILCKQKSQEE